MKFYRIILIILIGLSTITVNGQNIHSKKAKKENLEKEIKSIDLQLSKTKAKKLRSINSLTLTQKKISTRKILLREIQSEINDYNNQIFVHNKNITRLSSRLDTLEAYYKKLILNSYKNRDTRVWFMYLISSENIGQGYRRWNYLKNLSKSVKTQADKIRKTRTQLDTEKNQLKNLYKASVISKNQKQKEYIHLTNEQKQEQQTINYLKRKERKIKKQLAQKKKEVRKLNQEIKRLLAEAIKKAQETSAKNKKIDYALSANFSKNKGKLPWPVKNGVVVGKFGNSYHPVFKNLKMPFNNGCDISCTKNSTIHCVFAGDVKKVLIIPGYNQCILVQHGQYFTFYCKLKQVYVKAGQKLKTGQTIGIVGDDDNNSILHFQLWKGTEKQNPEKWLR
ncbi:MAG: peptidoglycan DD-metalloendopeptidase family protein [Bacteroidales bacterium]